MYFLNDGVVFLYKIRKDRLQINDAEELFQNMRFEHIDDWEIKEILERDGHFLKVFNTNFLIKKLGKNGYLIFRLIEKKEEEDFYILKLDFVGYYVKTEEKDLKEELENESKRE